MQFAITQIDNHAYILDQSYYEIYCGSEFHGITYDYRSGYHGKCREVKCVSGFYSHAR
ncbi:hypothetical protein APHWEB_1407 [Anaplasma phagocytophilum str. Webster]|nr:hypothetical protein APHWEB_1407 [Anaplasma phagocytophilum str. Webster]